MYLKSSKLVSCSLVAILSTTNLTYAQNETSPAMDDEYAYENSVQDTAFDDPILKAIQAANTQNSELSNELSDDVSQSILTIEDRKELASKFLKKGLNNSALEQYYVLKDEPSEQVYALYGEALALAGLGDFKDAYNKLENIATMDGKFQSPSKNYANALLLNIAEDALDKNNTEEARTYLNQFDMNLSSRGERLRHQKLTVRINRAERVKQGFDTLHSNKPLKIAILLPMSGENQFIGQQMLEAAQLALFNKPNPNILLYPQDTQSTEMGAIRAAQKAINDRADIILGPLTASNTKAVSPYVASAGVPLISFSSQSDVTNRYTSTLGFDPQEQARRVLQFAADKGVKSAAALVPDNLYGELMLEEFVKTAADLDISITDTAKFDPESPDQTAQLTQLANISEAKDALNEELNALEKEYASIGEAMDDDDLSRLQELRTAAPQPIVNFEALFLPVSAQKLPLIASQLAYYNMDSEHVMILGTGQWQNPDIYKNNAEYILGAYFAAPPQSDLEALYSKFGKTYGKTAHPLTLLAFDGVVLLSELYEQADENPYDLLEDLKQDNGFKLFSGRLRFNDQGTSERLYSIYEVRRHQAVSKQEAPSQFVPELPNTIDARERGTLRNIFNPWGF